LHSLEISTVLLCHRTQW